MSTPTEQNQELLVTPSEPIWGVVVIHGVGDTNPGMTLDAFMPAYLDSASNLHGDSHVETRYLPEPEAKLPDVASPLVPPPASDDPTLPNCFPMHHRWLKVDHPRPDTPAKAVIAEMHWADLSSTGDSWWYVLVQLFQVVFHLRFVADRGSASDESRPGRWLRFVLFAASWLLCGPVAALNLFLLYLLALQFLVQTVDAGLKPDNAGTGWVWLTGAFAVLGALGFFIVLGRKRITNPWKLLFGALGLVGLLLTAQAISPELLMASLGLLATLTGLILFRQAKNWGSPWRLIFGCLMVIGLLFAAVALAPHHFKLSALTQLIDSLLPQFSKGSDHILWYVAMVLAVILAAVYLLCILVWLAFALLLSIWWQRGRTWEGMPGVPIAFGAVLLQVGLWIIIVAALGLLAFRQFYPLLLNQEDSPFTRGLSAFVLNLILAAFVLLVVWGVWLTRWRLARRFNGPNIDPLEARQIPRLLINEWIVRALVLVSLGGMALVLVGVPTDWWPVHNSLTGITGRVITGAIIVLPLIWAYFQKGLRAGLHILMDVVYHFYHTRMKVPWPMGNPPYYPLNSLIIQMGIEARFRRVIQEVMQLGNVTHLTVVSHSQGTVSAINSLWLDWTGRLLEGKQVHLITMGSPFGHLYQHYFPERYPTLFTDPENKVFNSSRTEGWGSLRNNVDEWLNAFRVDDFVGTHIDGDDTGDGIGTFPENKPLPPGGHTGYWNDSDVLVAIQSHLPG